MRLSLRDNLPFVAVTPVQSGRKVDIPNVLIDTGSGGTIFSSDQVATIGIAPQGSDVLRHIHGVGGSEVVFMRKVEQLQVGEYACSDFEIEVGGMDYGFEIFGILGMDFLTTAGARINPENMVIEFKQP
jgi:hypothetical protein